MKGRSFALGALLLSSCLARSTELFPGLSVGDVTVHGDTNASDGVNATDAGDPEGPPCITDRRCGASCEDCTRRLWVCNAEATTCEPRTDCSGVADGTPCRVETVPDRDYDLCIGGSCVSPGCGDVSCNDTTLLFPWPDSGQRRCFDNASEIMCPGTIPCGTESFCGQDAQYGWDASHVASERYVVTEPVAGEALVLDQVTGLMWLRCPAGKHGLACDEGAELSATWDASLVLCDGWVWAGLGDWRLPSAQEWLSVLAIEAAPQALDASAFPASQATSFFTSTTWTTNPALAGIVELGGWGVTNSGKENAYGVRCVRATDPSRVALTPRFVRTSDSAAVVSDAATHLLWQGCPLGLSGSDCSQGSALKTSWPGALRACQDSSLAGHSDWRLAGAKELGSLFIYDPSLGNIDTVAFPNWTQYAWAATTFVSQAYAGNLTLSYTINPNEGMLGGPTTKTLLYGAYCVRDLP